MVRTYAALSGRYGKAVAKLGFWHGHKKESGPIDGAGAVTPAAVDLARQADLPKSWAGRNASLSLLHNYEDSGQGWFWATDVEGRVTYLTESVVPALCPDPSRLSGLTLADLFRPAEEADGSLRTLPFLLMKRAKFDRLTLRANISGDERWWSLSGTPQFDAAGVFMGYLGNGIDMTEQRRSTEHASKLAKNDPLTGLPNRLRMAEVLAADLMSLDYQKRSCAVILIDLDRFKQVNDTLGHLAGDALLTQVAERLRRIIEDDERIFRLGGDEFQIIIRDCDDRGTLGELANRVIAMLSQPYSVNGSRCIIGASVGIAMSPFDGRSSEDLIRNADLALYAAKASGRGRFRFFAKELLEAAEDRRILEEDLRDALAKGEISVFYQPIVDAKTDVMTGVEALVRWHHSVRGPISPALFIPIAEETNLITSIGEWVLRKACEDAARWPGRLRVAVNVSPIQFANDGLPAIVTSALASSGLEPDRLELEITEGVFLGESAATDTMFATLKDIGVRLALDDFGTGYSSLSYLRTAPFDKIKIDQSFVRAATLPRSRNRAIIAAIVALAEALGMETTAEGIESHDQLDLIRALKVSHIQGYIYSKPIAFEDMASRLDRGEWAITPSGPTRQRAERHSMYRNVGAIYGNHYRSVLIRNLSESGALIEGMSDIPLGSMLLIDFGEGQLAFARVRRSRRSQCGIEFEQPLVSDGNGGMCTSHRVSPYVLGKAGLPSLQSPGTPPDLSKAEISQNDNASSLEQVRRKLGLGFAPGSMRGQGRGGSAGADRPDDGDGIGQGSKGADAAATGQGPSDFDSNASRPGSPTIKELADRYLDHIRSDLRRHKIDDRYINETILPQFGSLRPDDLAPSQIAEWLAVKVREEGYPPAKVSRLQGILGQMYVLAMQWGMPSGGGGGGDAMQGIPMFSRSAHERCLTPEEIERLNAAAQASHNPQLKVIVSLLMLTGTRQRELLEAKWTDVDLAAGVWRIPTSEAGGIRTVSLSRAALELLTGLQRWPECEHLIVNPKTKKPYRALFASWDTARRKAGLADVELDDLRHSAASDEATSGLASIDTVRSVLTRQRRRSVIAPKGLGF